MKGIDSEIDRLYQLPPGEFIAARNALAKSAGPDAAAVRRAVKPSLPAWAVNQLYWKRRADYDALVSASTGLRKVHKAILGGQRGDIRDAAKAHDAAVDRALQSTLALLREEGQPPTDATRHAIQTTLRALPGKDPPGRLTHTLQPGGFEMLAGLSVSPFRGAARATKAAPEKRTAAHAAKPSTRETREKKEAAQKAREDVKATRTLQAAEHEAQREEFAAARAAREAERADRAVERAQQAVEGAQKDLAEAERHAGEAKRTMEAARRRAESATAEVERLKSR